MSGVKWSLVGGVGAAVILAACATNPNPIVVEARESYQKTATRQEVNQHASVELFEAQKVLTRLERAARNERGKAELEHLAALTRDRIEIAEVRARAGALRSEIEKLGEERDMLRLRSREVDAVAAERRAERAEAEAELARQAAIAASELAAERRGEVGELRKRAQELEAKLENVQASEDERGMVFMMRNVLFEFDSSEIKPGAARTLERIAELLNEYPQRSILVEGHTDSRGSDAYNLRLSELRARAVARVLEEQGVERSRVTARGLGEENPVASNAADEGRQQNRRVEIVLENERQ